MGLHGVRYAGDVEGVQVFDGRLVNSQICAVAPVDVPRYWDRMQPGLEHVLSRAQTNWRKEDLYYALRSGSAILMVSTEKWDGFMIATRIEGFCGPMFWIWVLYGEPGVNVRRYWKLLKEYVRSIGIDTIMFASSRRAWAREAVKYGAKAVSINYEMRI